MSEEYEVAIIGCGPAGLSAGIYTARAQLKTIIFGLPEKSQAQLAPAIENYFGFPENISGGVLVSKGIIHCTKFGAKFVKEEVVDVKENGKMFTVKTSSEKEFLARSLIIATGTPIKLSGIVNEEKLTGKGVHYCVNCDGAMYKNKKLAIIGNGDHAAEDAIEALSYTKDITIIANDDKFAFSDEYDKELTKWQIKTMLGRVKEFRSEKWLEDIVMADGKTLKLDAVFMACGSAGALDFAANLGLAAEKNILIIDENNMTNMAGVFAAGNCAGRCRQIAKNVGDGCNAALGVIRYLRSKENYMDYGHGAGIKVTDTMVEVEPVKEEKTTHEPIIPTEAVVKSMAKSLQAVAKTDLPVQQRKLRVGWFSFSCCEDSTIVFTELLNDYYYKWKDVLDIRHARVLRGKNDMSDLDIAFVEGAISNPKQEEEVKQIRANSKKVVAIGSCAVTGMPSGQRNEFDANRKREIDYVVKMFGYNEKVRALHDVIQVDDSVPGCPMTEVGFLTIVNKYLKEFGFSA